MSESTPERRIIIVSDDGDVYELTEEELKQYRVDDDKQNADHRNALRLAKHGAHHAVWKSRLGNYAYVYAYAYAYARFPVPARLEDDENDD